MKRALSVVWLFLLIVLGSQQSVWADTTLTVSLSGIEDSSGNLRVGLYNDPKTFRKETYAYAVQQVPAQQGTVTLRFEKVPAGIYAIMAYHDEDANGQMNRRLGMFPTEGYGLSNNPKIMGPPGFADSAFEVTANAEMSISILMHY